MGLPADDDSLASVAKWPIPASNCLIFELERTGSELASTSTNGNRFAMRPAFETLILDHLTTATLVFNRELGVEYLNSAAEALLGVSRRRVDGMRLDDLIRDDKGNFIERIVNTFDSGHPWTERERQLRYISGEDITVNCSTTIIEPGVDTKVMLEMVPLDRQLRILREDYLLQEQRATQSMLRGLAHEVKNPLGGLRGAAQLLESELPDPGLTEYTQIIIQEADRLHNLVDRMLGPSIVPNKVETNLHEALEHVRGLVEAELDSDIKIETDYDPSIPLLMVDRDLLIQAILNIVKNATRVVAENGSIVLRTRVLRHYTIAQVCHRLVACVSVVDDGPGIPEEIRSKVFFPMVSGRAEGTGLGLAISQMLINQHNGLIEFDSRVGRTEFRVLLPILNDEE